MKSFLQKTKLKIIPLLVVGFLFLCTLNAKAQEQIHEVERSICSKFPMLHICVGPGPEIPFLEDPHYPFPKYCTPKSKDPVCWEKTYRPKGYTITCQIDPVL